MRTEVGRDSKGKAIHEDDIVYHDNRRRPPGYFCVAWDDGKHGYVLLGCDPRGDDDGMTWLREWCCENVVIRIPAAERGKGI